MHKCAIMPGDDAQEKFELTLITEGDWIESDTEWEFNRWGTCAVDPNEWAVAVEKRANGDLRTDEKTISFKRTKDRKRTHFRFQITAAQHGPRPDKDRKTYQYDWFGEHLTEE